MPPWIDLRRRNLATGRVGGDAGGSDGGGGGGGDGDALVQRRCRRCCARCFSDEAVGPGVGAGGVGAEALRVRHVTRRHGAVEVAAARAVVVIGARGRRRADNAVAEGVRRDEDLDALLEHRGLERAVLNGVFAVVLVKDGQRQDDVLEQSLFGRHTLA